MGLVGRGRVAKVTLSRESLSLFIREFLMTVRPRAAAISIRKERFGSSGGAGGPQPYLSGQRLDMARESATDLRIAFVLLT